jgi:hypothetical protein
MIILTPEEQLLQDAMLMSSSPPPESLLGKRTRNEDGDDDGELVPTFPAPQPETSSPSTSNITAAALRYVTTKKLRPEQRDEAEAFLLVSCYFIAYFTLKSRRSQPRVVRPDCISPYCQLKTRLILFDRLRHLTRCLKSRRYVTIDSTSHCHSDDRRRLILITMVWLSSFLSTSVPTKGNIPINHVLVCSFLS